MKVLKKNRWINFFRGFKNSVKIEFNLIFKLFTEFKHLFSIIKNITEKLTFFF